LCWGLEESSHPAVLPGAQQSLHPAKPAETGETAGTAEKMMEPQYY